jgi:hypothetical protein
MARMSLDKVVVILGLGVLVAVVVLLNQYLRRRMNVSVALLLGGAVGSALVGAFWGYFYLYQA